MQPNFNTENLITYLKKEKKKILLFSLILTLIYGSFRIYTKLSKYEAQIRFYVTNSEAVDYKTILDKSFIDISVEQRDLLRLQSFGYSNQLLKLVADSIQKNKESLKEPIENEGLTERNLSKFYQVNISDLGELEITVRHENEEFCYLLCQQIMNGINTMNNIFLSDFKLDQIDASQRQLKLLSEEKKVVLEKINSLSKSINESDLKTVEQFGNKRLDNKELQEFLLNSVSPEKLELNLSFQKVQNLDDNIESFNKSLYNDKWSVEMLKKKKPFVTQNKPANYKFNFLNISILLITSFFTFLFIITLYYSLKFRYQKYINLLFS